jgi:hypothetical protein
MKIRMLVKIVSAIVIFIIFYLVFLVNGSMRTQAETNISPEKQIATNTLVTMTVNTTKDPLYELRQFLCNDKTFLHHYSNSYTCIDYCKDMIINGTKENLSCSLALIHHRDMSNHALVVFHIANYTDVFVEAQVGWFTNPYADSNLECIIIYPNDNPYYTI